MSFRVADPVGTARAYGAHQLADHLQRGFVSDADLAAANRIYQAVAGNPPPSYGPWANFGTQQRWQHEVDAAQNLYATAARLRNFQDPRALAAANAHQQGAWGWRPQPSYVPDPGYPMPYPERRHDKSALVASVAIGALVGLGVWASMRNTRGYW